MKNKIILLAIFALIASFLILQPATLVEKIISPITFTILIFVIIRPEFYFILFLTLRPCMDLMAERQIVGTLNAASIMTMLFILIGCIIILKKENIAKIMKNKFVVGTNKIFLCFLIFSLTSLINSSDFLTSLADWLRLVSIIIVFNYVFLYFSEDAKFKRLFILILLSAAIPLCLGAYQHFFNKGNHQTPGFNRIYGTFLHPNLLAQYLLILSLMILYFLKTYKPTKILKVISCVVLVVALFEILYTYSRGVWIALAISLIVFSGCYERTKRLFYFVLIFIRALVFFPKIHERFTDIGYLNSYRPNSWEWRIQVWTQTQSAVREHCIIGHGLGMFEKNFLFMAHNDYLRLIYETGILGLIAYLSFFFIIFTRTIRRMIHEKNIRLKFRYATIASLTLAFLVMGISDNLARSTVILLYMFCIIGALAGNESDISVFA